MDNFGIIGGQGRDGEEVRSTAMATIYVLIAAVAIGFALWL